MCITLLLYYFSIKIEMINGWISKKHLVNKCELMWINLLHNNINVIL